MDTVLEAQIGDVIEVSLSSCWDDTASVYRFLDVVSVVSAAPVNNWSAGVAETTTGQGVQAWRGILSTRTNVGGSVMNTLVAGDLSATGTVTLRLRYRGNDGSTARSLAASADQPLQFSAKNLGPVEPH